jgi:hypothetical protein
MSQTDSFLEQLYEADRQGQRAIASLWPGDQFVYRGQTHTVAKLQWDQSRRKVFVTTAEPVAEPYPFTKLAGTEALHQPRRTFLFDAMLLFTSFISDEHATAEQEQNV